MHSKNFELAKRRYSEGLWTKAMLRALVKANKLYAFEYKEITGEDY